MSLYRADVKISYSGQDMLNVLWYRDRDLVPVGIDPVTACRELGEAIRDNIILSAIGQTRMRDLPARNTKFTQVQVMRIDATSWNNELTAPVVTDVDVMSLSQAGDAWSPEGCYILNLRCGVQTLSPLDYTPRGGYLAIGPAQETATDPNGVLMPNFFNSLDNFGAALAQTLNIGGGFQCIPIRVGRGRNSFGTRVRGFADVISVDPSPRVSFRRSRRPR